MNIGSLAPRHPNLKQAGRVTAVAIAVSAVLVVAVSTTQADATKKRHDSGPPSVSSVVVGARSAAPTSAGHWALCFDNLHTYRAWAEVQVGMPRCDTLPSLLPQRLDAAISSSERARQSTSDSPCFMNTEQWDVSIEGGRPVCSLTR